MSSPEYNFLTTSPFAIAHHRIITDGSGKPIDFEFLDLNSAFEELLDLSAAKLVHRKAGETIPGHPIAGPGQLRLYGQVVAEKTSKYFEYRCPTLNRWFEVHVWSSPEESCFMTQHIDVTDRKTLEKDYEERKKELKIVYDMARISEKEDTTIDIVCQTLAESLPESFQDPEHTCCKITIDDREYRSANYMPTDMSISRLINCSGQTAGSISIGYFGQHTDNDGPYFLKEEKQLLDVAADWTGQFIRRKQSEEKLLEANSILSRSATVVFTWMNAPGWPVTYVSGNVASILGYDPEEFLSGKLNYQDCMHPDDAKRVIKEVNYNISKGNNEYIHEPYRVIAKDGELKWVYDWTFIVRDENGDISHFKGFIHDITRHKLAEDALKESEERFRKIFEIASLGIAQVNPNTGDILLVNKYYEEITGYTVDELLSMKFPELTHPDDRAADWDIFQRAARGEISYRNEKRYIRKDGSIVWVRLHVAFIRDEDGRPVRTVAICENITERKNTAEALRKSEENYRMLVENQSDLVVKVDTKGKFQYVSPSYCQLFGKTEEELLGNTYMPLVHEDDQESTEMAMTRLNEPPYEVYLEQRAMTKDGWRWLAWNDAALLDESGKVTGIIGVGRDITEQKKAEELAHRASQQLAFHIQNSPLAVVEWDDQFRVKTWSRRAEELFGWKAEEVVGKEPNEWTIIHADDREAVSRIMSELIDGTQPRNLSRNRNYTKDGRVVHCEWYNSAMFDSNGKLISIFSLVLDVSDRIHKEQELRRSLEEKTTLLQELYHRTKNNMQVISSMLMIHSMRSKDEHFVELAQDINNRIKSMSLVHQKLYESNNLSYIPFDDYIRDLFGELGSSYLVRPGQISLNLDSGALKLLIDTAIPCGLVLNELISNSIKHAFPGDRKGTITIKVIRRDDQKIHIHYSDDGVGLPPGFDPGKNGGMGWELLRMIVEYQLGGSITCRNGDGMACDILFTDDKYSERIRT